MLICIVHFACQCGGKAALGQQLTSGFHTAQQVRDVETESFQNQTAAQDVLTPALKKVFDEGSAPVSTLKETARLVEQSQVKR